MIDKAGHSQYEHIFCFVPIKQRHKYIFYDITIMALDHIHTYVELLNGISESNRLNTIFFLNAV